VDKPSNYQGLSTFVFPEESKLTREKRQKGQVENARFFGDFGKIKRAEITALKHIFY